MYFWSYAGILCCSAQEQGGYVCLGLNVGEGDLQLKEEK